MPLLTSVCRLQTQSVQYQRAYCSARISSCNNRIHGNGTNVTGTVGSRLAQVQPNSRLYGREVGQPKKAGNPASCQQIEAHVERSEAGNIVHLPFVMQTAVAQSDFVSYNRESQDTSLCSLQQFGQSREHWDRPAEAVVRDHKACAAKEHTLSALSKASPLQLRD